MNFPIVNNKLVKENQNMKQAQQEANQKYGFSFGKAPSAKINKVVSFQKMQYLDLTHEETDDDCQTEKKSDMQASDLIMMVRKAGITGLSGNGFDTADKLTTWNQAKSKQRSLIINAVECDPALAHDAWLLHNRITDMLQGIRLLKDTFRVDRVILASKEKPFIENPMFTMKKVPNRYPMGEERKLIQNVLGTSFEKKDIPAENGILVMNLQTLLAIKESVCNHISFQSRYITVANLQTAQATVVRVPFQADASMVMKQVYASEAGKDIYIGGGIMSCHKLEENEKILPTTNFLAVGKVATYQEPITCKKCGRCSRKCPAGVKVSQIVNASIKGETTDFAPFHPERCIGCGSCTYFCQAGNNVQKVIAHVNGKC